uniref:Putative secreted protein n=1 Tax=Anopheles marajoara TaxID=58244 RepID=A0A2M4C9G7_9DIPT
MVFVSLLLLLPMARGVGGDDEFSSESAPTALDDPLFRTLGNSKRKKKQAHKHTDELSTQSQQAQVDTRAHNYPHNLHWLPSYRARIKNNEMQI